MLVHLFGGFLPRLDLRKGFLIRAIGFSPAKIFKRSHKLLLFLDSIVKLDEIMRASNNSHEQRAIFAIA